MPSNEVLAAGDLDTERVTTDGHAVGTPGKPVDHD
jgi:hypothetical protein